MIRSVRSHDRSAFGHVEGLALGKSFDDVEDHDVTEFAVCNLLGEHAADVSAADQSNLVTHGEFSVGLFPADQWPDVQIPSMFSISTSPNPLHETRVAPSI